MQAEIISRHTFKEVKFHLLVMRLFHKKNINHDLTRDDKDKKNVSFSQDRNFHDHNVFTMNFELSLWTFTG